MGLPNAAKGFYYALLLFHNALIRLHNVGCHIVVIGFHNDLIRIHNVLIGPSNALNWVSGKADISVCIFGKGHYVFSKDLPPPKKRKSMVK